MCKTPEKQAVNPKKHSGYTRDSRDEEANRHQSASLRYSQKIFVIALIVNSLFLLRFTLDTPFPYPYYAARKF